MDHGHGEGRVDLIIIIIGIILGGKLGQFLGGGGSWVSFGGEVELFGGVGDFPCAPPPPPPPLDEILVGLGLIAACLEYTQFMISAFFLSILRTSAYLHGTCHRKVCSLHCCLDTPTLTVSQ